MDRTLPFPRTAPNSQRGAALLVFMLIFFLASMSWLLSQTDSSHLRSKADRTTTKALAQAKEALIGRAVADKERPGSLPCPDFDGDGKAVNGSCTATIGLLPWKTLDLPDLRDGDGNGLWYALAPELRDDDSSPPINPTQPLKLSIDGMENTAAIVFSAGPPHAEQNGRPSKNIKDYLDGANQDGGPYISGPTSSTFNDKTISISRDQLFRIVNHGVLALLSAELNEYYNIVNSYPEQTDLKIALSPSKDVLDKKEGLPEAEKRKLEKLVLMIEMLDANGWFAITKYTPAQDRKSATLAITVPPATTPTITCAIAPNAKPVCAHP